jgi:tRNA 5-methylaminomethyl-2-thiouridine biosynthesis bifunctional protein
MEYYSSHFPSHFKKAQLVHIAKDAKEEEMLRIFKAKTTLALKEVDESMKKLLTPDSLEKEKVSLEAGIVDAKKMCQAMIEGAKFVPQRVENIVWEDGYWLIDESYAAKELVLATGAYKSLLHEPYIELRGVWGHRVDIKTATQNRYSIHQFVSISPSEDGVLAIGATHNVHYHPEHSSKPYDLKEGRAELLEKASRTVDLRGAEVIKDYTGLRSGSFDYMPLVGPLVLSRETLACCEKNIRVKKPDFKTFHYYPHLTMINGSGGYGFVLAPYLARILKEYICDAQEISEQISPARFFARWAKRRS